MRTQIRWASLAIAVLLGLLSTNASATITPAIMIDGYADDWAGVEPTFEDPEGDAEDGYLDLTNVSTYADASGLYFLAEVADPAASLVQFDLEVRVGERSFLLTADKDAGTAFVAEVTSGHDPIADTQASTFAFGQAWEGFIAASDLPATGQIELVDICVMVGECCDEDWRQADRLTREAAELELRHVQRIDDPSTYVGQGVSWSDAAIRLRNLPGYELDHVWASAFSLCFQIADLPDGSIAVGDEERRRILRIAETGVSTLVSDVNGNWMATLPDGRLAYYSRAGSLMGYNMETERSDFLYDLPGVDGYRSPIGVDADGRLYGIDAGTRSLVRVTLGGRLERLTGTLPYDQSWHFTDIEVAEDGTVYIGGFEHVVAVDENGEFRMVADGLHHEPVFLDLGDDGTLYINELAKDFQAYVPTTGELRSVWNAHGFQDFIVRNVHDAVFFDSNGAYFGMDLATGETWPIARADTLNSAGFAADMSGGVYATTASLEPWGSHIVHLFPDGTFEELTDAVYWYIQSADVDAEGRLCYIADAELHRVETDGSITSWHLGLPGSEAQAISFGCAPDGSWVALTRSDKEFRVYRVEEGGQGRELTELRFTRDSFWRNVAVLDDARVDVGPDGRITMIVTARGTLQHGPYIQRIYQANADGSGLTEIADMDCQRVAGMVDVAVDPSGVVYALCVTGDTGSGDWIFRVVPGEKPNPVVLIDAGRDPRSIDVGAGGTIWFGTTLGVFRAYPAEGD